MHGVAIAFLFTLTGAAALVLEVLWMRAATAALGAAAPATAGTLAALFLGMAAGSAALGRSAARSPRPLALWGALEIGVASTALLVEPLLRAAGRITAGLHDLPGLAPGLRLAAELGLALAALALPAFFMGGTLPALAEARGGRSVAGLYALNTLGAASGALLAPLVLLPALGTRLALVVASSTSAAAGALAILLSRTRPAPAAPERARPAAARLACLPLVLAFLSGFAVLAFETLAARALALVHESSVLAFALVLAIFLVGLAAGAALAHLLLGRATGAGALVGAALLAGLAVLAFPHALFLASDGFAWAGAGPALAALAVPLLLPAATAAGLVFPLLLGRESAASARPGAACGRLLAANTLGAIAGPLAAGFLLAPGLGLWRATAAVAAAFLLAAALASSRRAIAAASLALAAAGFALAGNLPRVRLDPGRGERLVSIRDGALGTVAVVEDGDGDLRIKLDNHYVLGGTASRADERAQGHLPLLLHPGTRSVLFLGLGTGITASAAILHPLEERVAVELLPEAIAAARVDLARWNLSLGGQPPFRLVAGDARRVAASTARRHDVVIGDLFVPWKPGEGALYTVEAFAAARRALAPGGLFCQWLPPWQLSPDELALLVLTFAEVFPDPFALRGDFAPDGPALALCGGPTFRLDPEAVDAGVDRLAASLAGSSPLLSTPAGLWLHFLGWVHPGEAEARRVGPRRNRDATPWLELRSLAAPAPPRDGPPASRLAALRFTGPGGNDGALAAALGPARAGWREAGLALGRAALAAARGNRATASAEADAALAALPPDTAAAFLAPAR